MNKDLFLNVYKNKILNTLINRDIRYIHNKIDKDSKKFNWNELTKSSVVLSQYGYYHHFKLLPKSSVSIQYCSKKAVKYGHFHIIKYIIDQFKPSLLEIENIFSMALCTGNISIIEYVYSLQEWKTNKYGVYIICAAHSGRIEVCEWFVNHIKDVNLLNDNHIPMDFFIAAISLRSLDIVKWGIQYFIGYKADIEDIRLWRLAINKQDITLLDYMYDQEQFKSTFNLIHCMTDGIRYNNIKLIEWIFSKDDNGTLDNKEVFEALLGGGSVEIIEFCSDKLGYKIGEPYKNKAEWFYKKCEGYLDTNPIDLAIKWNRYTIIILLYENTDFRSSFNPLYNCDKSPLDFLKWFTDNNRLEKIPLDTLKRFGYIYSRYVPEDQYLAHLSIIDHIIRYRTEQFPDNQIILLFILLKSESLELADLFLMKNKQVTCSESTLESVISWNKFEGVKWIHNKYPTIRCTNDAIRSAYMLEDSIMIEWILQNRTESCRPIDIKKNFESYSTVIRSFILHNKPELIPDNVLDFVYKDFSHVKYIIDNYPTFIHKNASLLSVSLSGNVETVKYLHEYYKKRGINHKTNHFHITNFKRSLELAIQREFMDLIKYLCKNGPVIKISTNMPYDEPMLVACEHGNLEICKYLQDHTPYILQSNHLDKAVVNGNLELVRWIYENFGYKCSSNALYLAAKNRYFQVVRYLLDNNHELTLEMFEKAIQGSYLDIVKLYLEYRFKYDFNLVNIASLSPEIVKYLIENGFIGTNCSNNKEKENNNKRNGDKVEKRIYKKKKHK